MNRAKKDSLALEGWPTPLVEFERRWKDAKYFSVSPCETLPRPWQPHSLRHVVYLMNDWNKGLNLSALFI